MFVKLSAKQSKASSVNVYGPMWVNTENVCAIEHKTRFRDVGNPNGYVQDVWYSVTLVGEGVLSLDEKQGLELLASIEQIDGGAAVADGVLMREAATILDTNDFSDGKSLEDVGVTEPQMIDAVARVMRMRGTR